ncbi:SanA/YdcF family protein [Longispora fulva]|uniref:Vancomycin permeability regulator SanA n=1 Tax=Longispora fulva TaxID=619741 RepID=A0A8J7GZS7_9ACTN|nr:ElyC/SanA/YdcF family protein [Longispora fulva]MBG6141605.1 vancomycin permeability regulator SanA [Longispora fulva]
MWLNVRRALSPRRLFFAALAGLLGVGLTVGGAVALVSLAAGGQVYSANAVPVRPVAIVLGAQVNPDGQPSDFLRARLQLALDLYRAGKVRAILVSGDDGQPDYNEVDPMRGWLIDRGVPQTKVNGDYAGFDTYQSCVRAKRIFGVTSATVVTQSFHVTRAVALCRQQGIDAVGVGDDSMRKWPKPWWTGAVRDKVACVKAVLDIVGRPDPEFLGKRETAVQDSLRLD